MVNWVRLVIFKGQNFTKKPETWLQSFIWQKFYYSEKGIEKASNTDLRRGQRVPHHQSVARELYSFFNWLLTIDQKNVSKLERSYQIHSHSIHLKITELVRRFLRRRNMSSSKIHCCYIILAKEFRKKKFVLSSSLRIPDSYLLLESPRPLSPPDFLSTCLEIDSLKTAQMVNLYKIR